MKRISMALVSAGVMLAPGAGSAQTLQAGAELPPNPKAGECYARVHVPSQTRDVAKRVLVQEGGDELVAQKAEYRWVMKEVEVEAAFERVEVVPARFEMQRRQVVIEPSREVVEVAPAEYEVATEKVMVREAYQTWKPGTGPIQRYDSATGEIMCLVEVPAEYRTVKRKVVKRPARVERKTIPAKTETINVKVMVEPPRVRRIKIPAKTKQVRVQEQVRPVAISRRPIPAKYETVLETVKAGEGRVEWRPILCETNAKPDLIKDVQRALERAGYNPGPIDGILGRTTMDAVHQYQTRNGLARDFLTIETMQSLGIDPQS